MGPIPYLEIVLITDEPLEGDVKTAKLSGNITVQAVENVEKETVQPKISKTRLRNLNKCRKEKGLEYTRLNGTTAPARTIKPSCECKLNCRRKYPDTIRAQLLRNLLKLKTSGQNQFIANHISVKKTARPKVIIFNSTLNVK